MRHCRTYNKVHLRLFEQSQALPPVWDEMLPPGHFLHSAQLSVYERMALPDIRFQYALITCGNQPVALAYFQVLSIRDHHLSHSGLKPWQRRAWEAFTGVLHPRLLVAGHLFRHDICTFFWKEDRSHFDAFRMYQAAIRAAMRASRSHAVLVKDVNESLLPYFQHYAPGYLLLPSDISMELEPPPAWHSLQDYERALKHKYAQRFRKIRQSWDQLDVRELTAEETRAHRHDLFALYRQVSSRQPVRLGMLSVEFLPALKEMYPDRLHIWLAFHEGTPVAFFSAWSQDRVFDMFYIGFDYARNDQLQLYFNILFFALDQALREGRQRLILGRTALEAKARLGCQPRYLSTYLYIRNPLVRHIISRLQRSIRQEEGEWENRHPFKSG